MRRLLRLIASLIAIGGVIDPAIPWTGAARARLAIVAPSPGSAAADAARDRLIHDLSASYEVVPQLVSDAAAAIVIGERYPTEPVPDDLIASTVSIPAAAIPGVRIVRVDAPPAVPPSTLIHLDVELEASALAGQTTAVVAVIAGLETGRASHRWIRGEPRWRARLDAIPAGDPPYLVQLRLQSDPAEPGQVTSRPSGSSGTMADVVVDVRGAPLRVEFYDPRPSWATTFLRRALEADARFQVAGLSFTSRGVSTRTGGAVPLGDRRLDAFDAVIVGGLERLSAAEAGSLDRYMRERGGTVVLVPDQRLEAGPARDLVAARRPFGGGEAGVAGSPATAGRRAEREGPELAERLLEQPATLAVMPPAASLQASELLVTPALAPGAEAIARLPDADPAKALPVIVSAPRGSGRLVLSGAMDAWRFRAADDGAFDRFWQATIAGVALAAPPPIAIRVESPLLRPGEPGEVIVAVRPREVTAVSASLDGDQPIRLLPDPETGVYRGRFVASRRSGRSTIAVRAVAPQPLSASYAFLVSADAHRLPADGAPLAMLASSHRGVDVPPDRLEELERFLRGAIASPRIQHPRHPMRSVWWMLPFALCLTAEWWLRRRQGLR